jgi:hypothetical protein
MDKKQLNPRILHIDIGIKEVRKIKLYPLSVHDQMELSDLVTEAILTFFPKDEDGNKSDAEILSFAFDIIKENLGRIIEIVTDPEDKVSLKDIDNAQLSVIATAIIESNYTDEGLVKNVKSLFGKIQSLFPSKRPLSTFAGNIQDTGSNIFSGEDTGKAA